VRVGGEDHEIDRALARRLAQRRRRDRERQHARNRQQLGLQLLDDVGHAALARVPVDQPGERDALGDSRRACDHEDPVGLLDGAQDRLELARVLPGVFHRSAIGTIEDADNGGPVFDRGELALHAGEQDVACAAHANPHHDHQPALAQRESQHRGVATHHRAHHRVDAAHEEIGLRIVLEQLRAHHRRQRQRDEAGHDHRAGERQRKFGEQLAGAPGHEGHRCIHRGQRDRHRHHREADLLAPSEGGGLRFHALLDVAIDVLQHHDRIVHHQADRQHQREQGERIDRKAERSISVNAPTSDTGMVTSGTSMARQLRGRTGTPRHQQHRLPDGGEHRVDRTLDEHRAVVGDVIDMPSGSSACSRGIISSSPRLRSSGLAVACLMRPIETAAAHEAHRGPLVSGATSTRPTSRMRTG
jgi:hypothetical protein